MAALSSLLAVLTFSLLVTRVGAVALVLTGISRELARFQARSAFTGVGFTTRESEQIVNHPVRRRIIMLLMLLGNAGIVTVVSSLLLAFVNVTSPTAWLPRLAMLIGGLTLLWFVATSSWVDRYISRLIAWALRRWTKLTVRDYAMLLQLSGEYGIDELEVQTNDWLANKQLSQLQLRKEGITVLGIHRLDGSYIGSPNGSTSVNEGDVLILYGRISAFDELDSRKAGWGGEREHTQAIIKQQQISSKECE